MTYIFVGRNIKIKEDISQYCKKIIDDCNIIYGLYFPSGKWYVGQSISFWKNRFNEYKNNRCEQQPKLTSALKKYNWADISIVIFDYGIDIKDLDDREIYYVSKMKGFTCGYNCTPGGSSGGRGADNPQAVRCRAFNLTTGEISIFDCLLYAGKALNIDSNAISKVIMGRIYTTGGYTFQRYDNDEPNKPFDLTNVLTYEEARKKIVQASKLVKQKAVIGTHKLGYTIEFECMNDAARTLSLSSGHITDCAQGKREHTGNYMWRYVDEEERAKYPEWTRKKSGRCSKGAVYRILEDGSKDVYVSANNASHKTGIKHIQRSIEKGWKSGGYSWYYL